MDETNFNYNLLKSAKYMQGFLQKEKLKAMILAFLSENNFSQGTLISQLMIIVKVIVSYLNFYKYISIITNSFYFEIRKQHNFITYKKCLPTET